MISDFALQEFRVIFVQSVEASDQSVATLCSMAKYMKSRRASFNGLVLSPFSFGGELSKET